MESFFFPVRPGPAMKPALLSDRRKNAAGWLRRGKAVEARGTDADLAEAVQAYDAALALLRPEPLSGHDDVRHELVIAWMNRGRARQKQGGADGLADAVRAYDDAIALGSLLPIAINLDYRNCLGAAWLNRGQVLLQLGDPASLAAAIHSQEEAISLLRTLPIELDLDYRLNLAGAEINLANALLVAPESSALERARSAANRALALVANDENTVIQLSDLGLKARRALCDALGHLLFAAATDEAAIHLLAPEASDAVDTGLALARRWENHGVPYFRPLAARLFRFGAQLYQLHQPHFLAEFLLENLDPGSAPAAWTAAAEFQEIAMTAVICARQELARRPMLDVDPSTTAKLLETSRSLAEVERRISTLQQEFFPRSANSSASSFTAQGISSKP
jgi:hypothetical protein